MADNLYPDKIDGYPVGYSRNGVWLNAEQAKVFDAQSKTRAPAEQSKTSVVESDDSDADKKSKSESVKKRDYNVR